MFQILFSLSHENFTVFLESSSESLHVLIPN